MKQQLRSKVYGLITGGLCLFAGAACNAQIIISQVYEGASNNKWIEVTNVGTTTINLASPVQYKLAQWNQSGSNGNISTNGTPNSTVNLSGTLAPGEIYLMRHSSASSSVPHAPMPTANNSNQTVAGFNGNDGIGIITGTNTIVDIFGTGLNNTDISYHRNPDVLAPNSTFSVDEWTVKSLSEVASATSEMAEYIGIHIFGTATATTWNGTTWSNGTPTASIDAIIEGNYSTTSGLAAAKSLTVNSGVFTVASGTTLTIENEITNNSGAANFVVESGANLIQTENVANVGAVTVLRNSAPIVRLDHTLWSSPVANQNLFAFSPATLTNRFYTYETATDNYINSGLNAASVFEIGKGYGVRAPNNFQTTPAAEWTGNFVGIANNGNVTIPVSNVGNGFNLVGNPYPSAMSTSAVVAGNSNIGGTLYFYAHSLAMDANGQFPAGTNYALWNASGSTSATNSGIVPNGTIQVGQGFIVKAATAGNVSFNNTMRSNDVANQFFRVANNEVEKHRIWLNLSNNEGAFNQMLVAYIEGASNEIDRDFDGEAFGTTGSFIASKLNNRNYTIQGRALPFVDEDVVEINFHAATAGNFNISLSQFDGIFAADQAVYIKDNQTGATHDLKSAPYTFTTGTGDFNERFQIVYRSALSTPKATFNENAVMAFVNNNALNIQTKNVEMKNISIYDLRGRVLFNSANINAENFIVPNFAAQNQVLMVKVTSTDNEVATVKVIF